MEIAVTPQQVAFANPIRPQQKGYIYIWVSNESENTKVWFDDLKVTHRSRRVTQATDYYAYGSVLREQKTPEELTYRYKYQGQYAEKDEETGWSHFELREFDPIIGRWLVPDPMRQYWSPYVAYRNNPINIVDPRGGEGDPVIGQTDGNKIFTSSGWINMLDPVTVSPKNFNNTLKFIPHPADAVTNVFNNKYGYPGRGSIRYGIVFTSSGGIGMDFLGDRAIGTEMVNLTDVFTFFDIQPNGSPKDYSILDGEDLRDAIQEMKKNIVEGVHGGLIIKKDTVEGPYLRETNYMDYYFGTKNGSQLRYFIKVRTISGNDTVTKEVITPFFEK